MKTAILLAGAGVILGWLILQYSLESSAGMQVMWTAENALLGLLVFGLFAAFIYFIIKLNVRRY